MTTPRRKARLLAIPKTLPNELLDRLTSVYRFNAERRPNWTAVSIDVADLRAVLEANGIDVSNL